MLSKIISGGQTGADQAGLQAAVKCGLATGGSIPHGWKTDIGPDPTLQRFGLIEDKSSGYIPRTELNVRQSDGTVWLGDVTSPGGRCTVRFAECAGRPYIVNPSMNQLRDWILANDISILNVAGNRERMNPGITLRAENFLVRVFEMVKGERS